ncbi:MAG TPA: TlpA disulfide reductase family protein [Kofleriaceae bacterium]
MKLALVLACVAACTRPQHPIVAGDLVGRSAPPFALPIVGRDGSVALAKLAGHVIVVDFWASWCTPCEAALPHLDDWQRRFATRGLTVVGISGDDVADIAKFAATRDIAFPLVRDDGDEVASSYRIGALPTMVVIDKSGVVRYIDVGGRNFGAIETILVQLLAS